MNLDKDMKMTYARIFSVALVLASSFAMFAAPDPVCTIGSDSALLKPLQHPYTASHEEWTAAARVFFAITRSCTDGPANPKSRGRLFDYIDGKLSLDYDRLCDIWTHGNRGADGCVNEEEQHDLRAYLDKIVDPARDGAETGMILKHGNGLAISRFGPTVKSRVIELTRTSQQYTPLHDPAIEAFRALGYWLLPNEKRFTTEEKEGFTKLLLQSLPPADKVAGGRETLMTGVILQALGNSSRPDVAKALLTWAQVNQATRDYASPLAANAKTAALSVERRVQRDR